MTTLQFVTGGGTAVFAWGDCDSDFEVGEEFVVSLAFYPKGNLKKSIKLAVKEQVEYHELKDFTEVKLIRKPRVRLEDGDLWLDLTFEALGSVFSEGE